MVAVLDQLEANLRDEQRALSEQDYITFKQLLTPIQVRPRPLLHMVAATCHQTVLQCCSSKAPGCMRAE